MVHKSEPRRKRDWRQEQATHSSTGERLAYDFVADLCRAGANHTNVLGGSAGEIEHATANERATIVDANDDTAAVVAVGNFQLRAKCQ